MWIVALLGSQVLLHACGVCQLLPSWHPGALGLSKLPVVAQPIGRMDVELPLLQPGLHIYVLARFLRFPLANGDESVYAGLTTRLCQLRSKDMF